MKQYRLLRNNKESGPYSAEELIQTGFKPYDLIWIDGKSAAWRYPGEMEEFKLYAPAVEEQPFDRFYKKPVAETESKKESTTQIGREAIAPVIKETPASVASSSINAIPSVAVKVEKPRIRIKADSRKIEVPVAPEPIIQKEKIKRTLQEEKIKPALRKETIKPVHERKIVTTAQATTSPAWKDMWLDWEQEKKAVSAGNKISVKDNADTVLETKFAQSLDEIKERYVETVLKSKRASSISKSGNLITVFVLIGAILGFGMWMGFKWSGTSNPLTQQKVASIQPQTVKTLPDNEQVPEPNLSIVSTDTKTFPVADENKTSTEDRKTSASLKEHGASTVKQPLTRNTTPVLKKPQVSHSVNKLSENKSAYQPPQKKLAQDATPPQESHAASTNKTPQKDDAAENNASAEPKNEDPSAGFNHFKPQPKVTDFIAVDTYVPAPGSAVGVKLRVQNISDLPVDMVMVDLHYYDANGRYQTGATVYVRNINAGQTVTVPAPDNSHAVKVNYRIAMVSSEKNNMYLIAD